MNGLNVAVVVYSLVALRDIQFGSAWSIILPVGVLWLLYGSPSTRAYFER